MRSDGKMLRILIRNSVSIVACGRVMNGRFSARSTSPLHSPRGLLVGSKDLGLLPEGSAMIPCLSGNREQPTVRGRPTPKISPLREPGKYQACRPRAGEEQDFNRPRSRVPLFFSGFFCDYQRTFGREEGLQD